MAYVEVWDETKPAGSRDANLGDDDIREFKRAIRERLAGGGMYWPSTDDADAGRNNWLDLIEQSSNPTSGTNRGFVFTKDVSGATELHYMDASGNVVQLTTGGKIPITSLFVTSEARGDIIRRGASSWERLALGSNGQALKSNGTDATWEDLNFQTAATQAEMEAATSDTVPVTPLKVKNHPGVAKAWAMFNGNTAGTNAPTAGHNVATVEKTGTGQYSILFTTALSTANYVVLPANNATGGFSYVISKATTGFSMVVVNEAGSALDIADVAFAVFGDF